MEILLFLDAGFTLHSTAPAQQRFVEYIQLIVQQSKYDVLTFAPSTGGTERCWTSKRIFDFYGVKGTSRWLKDTAQYGSGTLMMRKGAHFHKWMTAVNLAMSTDPWLFSDKYDDEGTEPCYKENRHDQSIMSVSLKLLGCVGPVEDETWIPLFDEVHSRNQWESDGGKKLGRLNSCPFWATRLGKR